MSIHVLDEKTRRICHALWQRAGPRPAVRDIWRDGSGGIQRAGISVIVSPQQVPLHRSPHLVSPGPIVPHPQRARHDGLHEPLRRASLGSHSLTLRVGWTYPPGHWTETEAARGHRRMSGTGRVSRTAAHLALGLLNVHKDGAVFEDPHITGGFRDDDSDSLSH